MGFAARLYKRFLVLRLMKGKQSFKQVLVPPHPETLLRVQLVSIRPGCRRTVPQAAGAAASRGSLHLISARVTPIVHRNEVIGCTFIEKPSA